MSADPEFLDRLRTLAETVRGADPALHDLAYFRTPTDDEMVKIHRSVVALLFEASEAAELLLDELLPRLLGTPLEDLAAVVDGEVRYDLLKVQLLSDTSSTTWEFGIVAVQLLSKVLKAAVAVENAYCQEHEIPSEISHVAETRVAVEIRRAYRRFWLRIDPSPPSTRDGIEARLRTAGTSIASLRGAPIFLDLRPLDRRTLLQLQRRIRDWLAQPGEVQSGRQLWHDVVAFAELLRLINHRIELVEHDSQIVRTLILEIERAPDGRPFIDDPDLLEWAQKIVGRDPRLDEMVEAPAEATSSAVLEILGDMTAELSHTCYQSQSL